MSDCNQFINEPPVEDNDTESYHYVRIPRQFFYSPVMSGRVYRRIKSDLRAKGYHVRELGMGNAAVFCAYCNCPEIHEVVWTTDEAEDSDDDLGYLTGRAAFHVCMDCDRATQEHEIGEGMPLPTGTLYDSNPLTKRNAELLHLVTA